jgi:tRNA A37 threonylcarbamoyladenosine dehydratase
MFTKSRTRERHVLYRTKHLQPRTKDEPQVSAPQQKLKAYNQEARARAKVMLIGGGGLGGESGEAEVRKGIGALLIFDHDVVELSNLNRQFGSLVIPGSHNAMISGQIRNARISPAGFFETNV